jgi:Epoxide hydrolase N terminus
MTDTTAASETATTESAIRPFQAGVPEEELGDLRRRIAADPLATMRELARRWATDYDWRTVDARLQARPQFITEIDGVDIHFIHVRSKHDGALPLVVDVASR